MYPQNDLKNGQLCGINVGTGGMVLNNDDGLLLIDFFVALSGVLTPKSGVLFDFLSKSIMRDANGEPLSIDYTAVGISTEALENSVLVSSRNPIVDSLDAEDLDTISICFKSEFASCETMGFEFYSPSYKPKLGFYDAEFRFTDEYRFSYYVDFKTKTVKNLSWG